MGRTRPRSVISPVMATSWRTRMIRQGGHERGRHRDASGRPVLRNGALRHVDVNVDLLVKVGRKTKSDGCAIAHMTAPSARSPS